MSDRRRVDDPESLSRDTVTTVLRRMLVLALAGGCPTILVNIVVVGPTDPFVRWAFPPLLVHLLVYGWVLLRRPAAALWFSRLTLVAFEVVWVAGMVVRLRTADDATAVWHGLFPTTFMGPVVFLVVGFLVCASRGALRNAVGLGAGFLLGGLYGLLPAGDLVLVRDLVRYVIYLGVVAVLLHVLSHAKSRLAVSVAAAEQARDEALHLRDIAYRDSLTGIANRRRLVEELTFRAERVGPANPVAVVYFDLDHLRASTTSTAMAPETRCCAASPTSPRAWCGRRTSSDASAVRSSSSSPREPRTSARSSSPSGSASSCLRRSGRRWA